VTESLVITVHGKPGPQGSKRHVGNGVMVESSAKVKPWREAVKAAALQAGAAERLEGPVEVAVCFCFDKPKSAPKRRRTWPTTRSSGDVDKLLRATFDALTDAGVFRDDSQVVHVSAWKAFTDEDDAPMRLPGATIRVREVSGA
jgi:crossover junction endodeoxyribonuclease RusA